MNKRPLSSAPGLLLPLAAVAALLITGCSKAGPQRAPIKGKITVGGAPLASGQILFVPQPPLEGPATTAAIVNGEYSLPKDRGPIVGTNRVEVQADLNLGFPIDDEQAFVARQGAPLPPNPIPPTFNRQSTLTHEVKADFENVFELNIPAGR
jgi:hypothetical protein